MKASGSDAASFLQGQFTNDLRALDRAPCVYGLWLTVKGKVLADSVVVRGNTAGEFWIGSYFVPAAVIRDRLESHVIADDVVIEDHTAEWAGVSLLGERWREERLKAPPNAVAFPGRRTRGVNIEWVAPRADIDGLPPLLPDAVELQADEIEALRVEAGIPAVPMDIGPGELPNEGGLEADAISYTKGCYLGQEVMARLKTMGQVRRRLLRVRIEHGPRPALPSPLFAGEKRVGELRSVVADPAGNGFVGLALLSLLHLTGTTALAFAPAEPPCVTLLDLP